MEIEFRSIDQTNYIECIELSVSENQAGYVAPNQFSLVQAAYEANLYPLAIYNKSQMVGFILYDFDEELKGWSMSRFMIGASFQGKGFGKAALKQFLKFFTESYPTVSRLYTSAAVDNDTAIGLYKRAGFKEGDVFEYESSGVHYKEIRLMASFTDQNINRLDAFDESN